MITDEQIRLVANILLNAPFGHNPPDDWMTDTRKALEAYEASKWVKFDVNDVSTWPQRKGHHIVCDGRNVAHKYWVNTGDRRFGNNSWFVADSVLFKKVTHWQPLPEFKE